MTGTMAIGTTAPGTRSKLKGGVRRTPPFFSASNRRAGNYSPSQKSVTEIPWVRAFATSFGRLFVPVNKICDLIKTRQLAIGPFAGFRRRVKVISLCPREAVMGHFRNAQGEAAGTVTYTDFMHDPAARDRFSLDLKCPRCGQIGIITWEENSTGHRQLGSEGQLIDVTPGFHSEEGRTQSGDPMIICNHCDTIQPD